MGAGTGGGGGPLVAGICVGVRGLDISSGGAGMGASTGGGCGPLVASVHMGI